MADGNPVASSAVNASDATLVPALPTAQLTTFEVVIPISAIIGGVGVLLLILVLLIKRRHGSNP